MGAFSSCAVIPGLLKMRCNFEWTLPKAAYAS